jgi:hypothetical protein
MTGVKTKPKFTMEQQAFIEVSQAQQAAENAGIDAHDNICDSLEKVCPSLADWREKQFREGNVVYPDLKQVLEFIFGKSISNVTPDIKGTDN